MTTNDAAQALIAVAQDLVDRAASDPVLAERLLADANGAVAEAAGQPIPAGILLKAQRRADGAVELSSSVDTEFQGELEDSALESVAGGTILGPGTGLLLRPLIAGARAHGGQAALGGPGPLGTNYGRDV